MEVQSSKENQSQLPAVERSKPVWVEVRGRKQLASGRWNNDGMADWAIENASDEWQSIGRLANAAYGNGAPRTKARVRQCIAGLRKTLLTRGALLLVEPEGPHHRAKAVKLYDPTSQLDHQMACEQVERMHRRRELSERGYLQALAILTAPAQAAE